MPLRRLSALEPEKAPAQQADCEAVIDIMLPHVPSPKPRRLPDALYCQMCRIAQTFREWSFRTAEYLGLLKQLMQEQASRDDAAGLRLTSDDDGFVHRELLAPAQSTECLGPEPRAHYTCTSALIREARGSWPS